MKWNEKKYDEVDMIELVLFLFSKYKSIALTVMFFTLIGVIFAIATKNIVQMRIKINLNPDTPSTYVLGGLEERQCRAAVIINTFTDLIPDELKNTVVPDKTNHSLTISISDNRENIAVSVEKIKFAVSKMQKWYISDSDLKNYTLTASMTGTETYTRLTLLSDAVRHRNNFIIISSEITQKYKTILVILLSGIIGGALAVAYHLFSRALKITNKCY